MKHNRISMCVLELQILDTPCAAGARSDGLRPSTRILPSSKRTLRNVSRTSQRQFEIPARKSPSAGMESVRNHDHCFLICCQKVPKWGSEKWSLNRPIPALNFFERCSLLDPSKSKVQTASRQKRRGTLHIPLAKSNYSPNGRTNGNQIFWYPRTERALRAINC